MTADLRLLARLGRGAMAEVFLAEDADQKRVAVKRILAPLAQNERARAMFREEAELMLALGHPNIPQIYATHFDGDEPAFVFEYADAGTLRDLSRRVLGQGPYPLNVATYIAHEVCAALGAAHALRTEDGADRNVVHRDIAPDNVLLTKAGDVKLTDFGVARQDARPRRTRTGALVGKTLYMSPEQARGERADKRADVFSFGVMLYEILCAHHPYRKGNEKDTLLAIGKARIGDPRKLNPDIDAKTAKVLARCLRREPDKRFSDAQPLFEALHALQTDEERAGARHKLTGLIKTFAPPRPLFNEMDLEATEHEMLDGTLTDISDG